MRVHLLRHGEAVSADDPAIERDAERPLTERGRAQIQRAAEGAASLGLQPDRVLASPYARARQSAKAARAVFDPVPEQGELHELRPGADPANTRRALEGLDDADSVLLCGHRPHLPRLVSYLLTGQAEGIDIDVPKAAWITIDVTALGSPEALGRLELVLPIEAQPSSRR